LAGAVGDALGAPVEFSSWREIEHRYGPEGVTGYIGERGRFTDDTQMTLFTAEGVIRAIHRASDRGLCDPTTVVKHALLRWLVTQDGDRVLSGEQRGWVLSGWLIQDQRLHVRRAPGNTCLSGLHRQLEAWRNEQPIEGPINDSKGCGGVMRAAPCGLSAHPEPYQLAVETSALTHGHRCGTEASGLLAEIVHAIVSGAELKTAVDLTFERLRPQLHDDLAERIQQAIDLARDPWVRPRPETIERMGGGWVAEEALAIGIYCALVAEDVRHGLLLAVNHSGDTDSTGSIAGNLLGVACGVGAIPRDWIDGLYAADLVIRMAGDLDDAVEERGIDGERYPPN
jgi:ADP-ribosylglycohydrolase